MAIRYKPEVHAFILANYKGRRVRELMELTNREMGTAFTLTGMRSYLKNRGLKNGMPTGLKRGEAPSKYPPGMEDFIRSVAPGTKIDEIARITAEHFEIEFTGKQARAYMQNHGITNGLDCRFKKGQEPKNKGKTQAEYMTPEAIERTKATRFKKGNIPHNYVPIGTVVPDTEGYLKKKIGDPNRWKYLHRLTWEEHYGPIPRGLIVGFKDGDRTNCQIENLYLKDHAEHAVMTTLHLQSEHPELTEVGLSVAKLRLAQNRAKKKKRRKV